MGILDELSSATGDDTSNTELVKRCLQTPALLHTVAEGLRTGLPAIRLDCALIIHEVAKRRPELLASFVSDFLDASRDAQHKGGSKTIAKLAFGGLALVTPVQPADVFAERSYLQDVAKGGGPIGIAAASVVAALCRDNANYRGKLLGPLLRLLAEVPDKDLAKWLVAVGPAVEGSLDSVRRLEQAIDARRETLADAARKKVDRLLVKLERTTIKPGKAGKQK